ncbi:11731_t:CDS:2 [Funneliformis mosseae]|uniref:11731_t:CDS:1 n=1 Tax=Funneliformis mosseae TaxID=27381 RepID=A0A9N9GPG7_FUNMO|nr:11731_t:CDS:2 [Funneliformis mosseae]
MVSNIIKAVEENIKDSDVELIVNASDITPDDTEQEPYRTIPKKLRDYGSKHASRIHDGKNPTPQHLKLLSRIALRQESDHLDAGDNYAMGDTELEDDVSDYGNGFNVS